MLYQIMKNVRNFFVVERYTDTFKIENGSVGLSFLQSGQYFLIEGSVFNDGVYKKTNDLELIDETFNGTISALNPDKEFLALVAEIESYVANNNQNTPYTSESFGGYSYSKATGASGMPATWQDVFKTRLKLWRKM